MARGHLHKRGDVWYAVVDYPRDPATPNKRNQKSIRLKEARTKREADSALIKLLREIDTGMAVEPSRITVGEFLERWLATEATNRVRATTLESYARMVHLHIVPLLGQRKLQSIRPTDIVDFYGHLTSPATAKNCRAVLSGAMKTAVRWGWIYANPVRDVSPPAYKAEAGDAWTSDECKAFLAAVEGKRWALAYRVVLGTGLRLGELVDLRWADIDLPNKRLTVSRTAVWVARVYSSNPPKSGQSREITLGADTLTALRQQHTRVREDQMRAEQWTNEDRAFPNLRGMVVRRDTLGGQFARDVRQTGVRPIRFHDLRHTHATLLLEAGVPIKTVSDRLGHANIGITADVYQHISGDMRRAAADVIDQLLAG